ncbi:acyl-coenzyme A thioesterase THEM4-like [Delphinapterus leucas]|uniref:Acyl-coenzyme A thioesterase THEM4-like n=1 Tax=Delphinapterus leucas TaxID=9749 RepID=A0A2Y9MB04_DELLE|nr:acyl-coenzyme A thioesterase THEM4-like [Delphinapterus leucas]
MVEDTHHFFWITEMKKLGFEYVIFHSALEKKCICLLQPEPLLEGLPGVIHGGALGTMTDTFFMTVFNSANAVFTGTMTITFKRPLTLSSVVRLKAKVTGMEGRKVFLSCETQSSDRTVLFAKASEIQRVDNLQHISGTKFSAFKGKCGSAKTIKLCLMEKYSTLLRVLIQINYN